MVNSCKIFADLPVHATAIVMTFSVHPAMIVTNAFTCINQVESFYDYCLI